MHIVHFTVAYAPKIGGMEYVVKELAERTAKMGHDVTVLTSSFRGMNRIEKKGSLTVHRMWTIRLPFVAEIMPLLPFKLLKLIKHDTVIHVHYTFLYFMNIIFPIAKMKRCRVVTHLHIDPPPSSPLGFLNPFYKELVWRSVLSLSDVIICPTQDYVDIALRNNMRESKCIIVPSGIDTKLFKRKDSCDITTPVKVLFVGRLHAQKNIPRLLEAFKLFQQDYEAVLRIVGEGEEKKTIENFIRKNRMPNIIIEGALIGEKLADAYVSSDIFVLTSDFESFGIVNLEAMASGLPIIASNIPAVRNLLEHCAILVEPTPENFAAAMKNLVEDSNLRKKLVGKGLEKVRDYDWDRITERVIGIYRKTNT